MFITKRVAIIGVVGLLVLSLICINMKLSFGSTQYQNLKIHVQKTNQFDKIFK
jgi:hypothetical protein